MPLKPRPLEPVGKGLGDDGGHQAFDVVFELGGGFLGRRHPGPVDDLEENIILLASGLNKYHQFALIRWDQIGPRVK